MRDVVVKDRENLPEHFSPHARIDLAAVTMLALAARLAWVWFGAWVSGDSQWYLTVARNVAFRHVFSSSGGTDLISTAFRPPLYPAVIALLWFGNAEPIFATLLLQAALGTVTVALVYLIARDQFRRDVALLAGLGLALAPMTGRFTAVVLSESLFTFLLLLGVFLWGRKHYVSTGVVFGLAALARVTILPFVVLLPLLSLLLQPWRSHRRKYATIMFLSLAIASIWIARNAVVFHRFIPVAASGYGTNLLIGSMETKEADDVTTRKALLGSVDAAGGNPSADETESDRVRLRAAVRRIVANPQRWLLARAQQYPRLFIDSGSYLFGSDGIPFMAVLREKRVGQATVRIGFILGNVLVFFFALVGLVAERARFVMLSHIVLFPIFLSAISLPLWLEPRYGLPMMPLVAILAASGVFVVVKLRPAFAGTNRVT